MGVNGSGAFPASGHYGPGRQWRMPGPRRLQLRGQRRNGGHDYARVTGFPLLDAGRQTSTNNWRRATPLVP